MTCAQRDSLVSVSAGTHNKTDRTSNGFKLAKLLRYWHGIEAVLGQCLPSAGNEAEAAIKVPHPRQPQLGLLRGAICFFY